MRIIPDNLTESQVDMASQLAGAPEVRAARERCRSCPGLAIPDMRPLEKR